MTTLNQSITAYFADAKAQVEALTSQYAEGVREVTIAGETLRMVAAGDSACLHASNGDEWLVICANGEWRIGHRWPGKPSYNTTML